MAQYRLGLQRASSQLLQCPPGFQDISHTEGIVSISQLLSPAEQGEGCFVAFELEQRASITKRGSSIRQENESLGSFRVEQMY